MGFYSMTPVITFVTVKLFKYMLIFTNVLHILY